MRRRKSWMMWSVFVAAAVILLAGFYYYGMSQEKSKRKPLVYSVVLYQNTDNQWTTLTDGIHQAEEDLNVKVNYITMSPGDTVEDEAAVIRREAEAGVNGILTAAADSRELARLLDEMHVTIPVITVETGLDGKKSNIPDISADNYAMGQALGEEILKDMKEAGGSRSVTVIKEYMERDSVRQRYQGLVDTLESSGENIFIHPAVREDKSYDLSLFIGSVLWESGPYIAALDKCSTEAAAEAWKTGYSVYKEQGMSFRIYGIGNTAQTVNDLDNGRLSALVYQNEFNMGYEGIQALVKKEERGYFPDGFDIRYKLVTKDTLYEQENERLLFPSI